MKNKAHAPAVRQPVQAADRFARLEPARQAPARRAPASASGWRMSRLDDLTLYAGSASEVIALVARDKRLLRLELSLPPAVTTWRLAVQDAALADEWLQGTV